jgi:hypothetical protein
VCLPSGVCPDVQCETDLEPLPSAQARAQNKDVYSTETSPSDEGVLMASTSVFVLDPGDSPSEYRPGTGVILGQNRIFVL